MNYDTRYPSIADLKARAQKRMPGFAFDYVDGAIDQEHGKRRNREAWHEVVLTPRYLRDVTHTDLRTTLFGREYALPIGIPPVGLGNMMWPGAELALARAAAKANIPFTLSTFGTTELEKIAEAAGECAWFQLYVPRQEAVMKDLLARVKAAGYQVLVVTLDIPVGAKRNRELKNGLKLPFSITPKMLAQCLSHPNWALQTLVHGSPDFVNVQKYRKDKNLGLGEFITSFNMHGVSEARLKMIRNLWDRALVLKGVQHLDDMQRAAKIGVDGIVISNHGGRQLDAAPASAETLRAVPAAVAKSMCVMVDCGIRTGTDVVRAGALGAQMAFSGRAFYWGLGALGRPGATQVIEIFRDEITRTLKQVGAAGFAQLDASYLGQT